ncbi:histone deacetylase [candidate division WOR-3 bacterium]|nr:histone deacetylase [candidate division WOR-3 bacterium]
MKQTGIVYHKDYLKHEQSPMHPESKARLISTLDFFTKKGLFDNPKIKLIEPTLASLKDILAVHHQRYIEFLKEESETGGVIDPDTTIPAGLFDIALLAAGGAIKAAQAIIKKEVNNAFAMIRPPGHHAKPHTGGGFCYLNNIAIAVRWLQRNGFRKILIIDWDAHHGNGTQEVFYEDDSVLFISLHQVPLYPGTGYPNEVGKGNGEGYTVNVPLPPGASDKCYMLVFDEIIKPLTEEFKPEFIAVSTGFDNHFTDLLTSLAITAKGYTEMMSEAVKLAEKLCEGRIFAVLEGGYSITKGLPYSMLGIVVAMAGLDILIEEPENYMDELILVKRDGAYEIVKKYIDTVKKIHSQYWKCF